MKLNVTCVVPLLLLIVSVLAEFEESFDDTIMPQRERFLKFQNTDCRGTDNGIQVTGSCLEKVECALHGGRVIGTCAAIGTCCYIQRTCDQFSHYKVSYFVSPSTYRSQCAYRVNVLNRDVCQIRLDFENFNLAQPTRSNTIAYYNGTVREGYSCRNDTFTVSGQQFANNYLGFESLCGNNDGQHIYIPVNATLGMTPIFLNFALGSRTTGAGVASWRIKVTQLECNNNAMYNYSTFTSTLQSIGQQHLRNKLAANNDYYMIAPEGCLQYYPERSGTYMSFNYGNGGQGPYMRNLNYAICFKRYTDVCGIRHTSQMFSLPFNAPVPPYNDNSCSGIVDSIYTNNDYLFIPLGVDAARVTRNMYCGLDLSNVTTVTSTAPGPLYVVFHTDPYEDIRVTSENGFLMSYTLLSGSCPMQTGILG